MQIRSQGTNRLAAAIVACFLLLSGTAGAQRPPGQQNPTDRSDPPSISLSELEALLDQDTEAAEAPSSDEVLDLVLLGAFLLVALISFLSKSRPLKYVTLVASVAYLGFMKSSLVSIVNIFGLLEWSFPIFRYNLFWYLIMIFTVVSTVVWGRLYCGRICAFGALTQLLDVVVPSRLQVKIPKRIESQAGYIKFAILAGAILYFVATKDNLIYRYIEPFWMFTLQGSVPMWTMLAAVLFASVFVRNFYCRFLCPLGAALGLLSKVSFFRIKRWEECSTCKLCEKECEWGAIRGPEILVTECVRCDDCEILYSDEEKCPHWLILARSSSERRPIPKTVQIEV